MEALKASIIAENIVEEQVTVNQRHLIDKILARYSAEFTVFRELLQNSNDAGATEVEIVFRTNAAQLLAADKQKREQERKQRESKPRLILAS
ncbi:hypothetical protein HK102_004940, partial [Quaeritorhiza haematococci]